MKTTEELNTLKAEVSAMNRKLAELNEDELAQVNGGFIPPYPPTASSGDEQAFKGTFNGSSSKVNLEIDLGPKEYDCSGLVD